MAAAVSGAGALGSLPGAAMTPQALRDAVAELRRGGRRPVNLNFFCHAAPAADPAREAAWREALRPYYDELGCRSRRSRTAGPPAVRRRGRRRDRGDCGPRWSASISACRPRRLLERVRARGRAGVVVRDDAWPRRSWLAAHGVDAIIAQGVEAGGHRGVFLPRRGASTRDAAAGRCALLPHSCEAVRVPVIAAGGIPTRTASPPRCAWAPARCRSGTAFLLCPEATTSAVHRAALQGEARARHRAHQPVQRTPGARHRQPPDARARADRATRRPRSRRPSTPSRRCAPPRSRPAAATSRRCGRDRTRAAAARSRRAMVKALASKLERHLPRRCRRSTGRRGAPQWR